MHDNLFTNLFKNKTEESEGRFETSLIGDCYHNDRVGRDLFEDLDNNLKEPKSAIIILSQRLICDMEDIERFIKILEQKRIADQRELDRLDTESDEHKKLMKELRDLRTEREQCLENITKHLNTITSHKHSIHKIIHSTKDVTGLPVPHDYAQDMKTMFTDAIDFLNNIGDIHKALTNVKENDVNPLKLIQNVTAATEAVGNKLYQTKCSIAQLETLQENIATLQQYILDNSTTIEDESLNLTNLDDLTESTIM